MSEIIVFHHVLGRTPGVQDFAARLRAAGHTVEAPDLFEGRTFSDLGAGLAYVDDLGMDELLRRADAAATAIPPGAVVAGFSLGAVPAQHLLQTRAGLGGGILLHAFVDPRQLDGTWPDGVPVHVLAMDADPFFVGDGDLDAARAWQDGHPELQVHLYPGAGHLFLEPGLPDHDAAVAEQAVHDVLAALAGMPGKD